MKNKKHDVCDDEEFDDEELKEVIQDAKDFHRISKKIDKLLG